MANKKKKISAIERRRKFRGNKYTALRAATNKPTDEEAVQSTSAKKLKHVVINDQDTDSFFFFMHFKQLKLNFEMSIKTHIGSR